jgi:hypothetical protein
MSCCQFFCYRSPFSCCQFFCYRSLSLFFCYRSTSLCSLIVSFLLSVLVLLLVVVSFRLLSVLLLSLPVSVSGPRFCSLVVSSCLRSSFCYRYFRYLFPAPLRFFLVSIVAVILCLCPGFVSLVVIYSFSGVAGDRTHDPLICRQIVLPLHHCARSE